MKRMVLAIALAFAFALPSAGTAQADPRYVVVKSDTKVYQHAHGKGHVRCTVQIDDYVFRNWGENWSRWIYVDVMYGSVPHWNCSGWIDKRRIRAD